MSEQYVATSELPSAILNVLKQVGYKRRDIRVRTGTTYSLRYGGDDGSRGFTAAVNLTTGRSEITWGSWGGANMFNPRNQVDLDDTPRPLPPNSAIIQGQSGGHGTFASILIHPSNIQALLPAPDAEIELSEKEKKALDLIAGYTSAYRIEYFQRYGLGPYGPTNPIVKSLEQKGLVQTNSRAVMVTTKGRNMRTERYASALEEAWGATMQVEANASDGLSGLPFIRVAGQDPKVIEMAVNNRMQYDWYNDPRDGKYKEQESLEGFREFLLPRAEKSFRQYNEIIADAVKRILKRVTLFEKSALEDFASLGYEVMLHKPVSSVSSPNWADYDYQQRVDVTDLLTGGRATLTLTWGFRSWLQVSSRNWTTFVADNSPKAGFAQILLTLYNRSHTETQPQWNNWVQWRREQLKAKGM